MQPLGRNPYQDHDAIRTENRKESAYMLARAYGPVEWGSQLKGSYRLPVEGEQVKLMGIRSQPDLNGACCEVFRGADTEGFVTVRVAGARTRGSYRKVHLGRLQPLPGAADPPVAPHLRGARGQAPSAATTCDWGSLSSIGGRTGISRAPSSRRLGSTSSVALRSFSGTD
mmetsp:Transcript_74537/g.207101  ORF Transcript_74537/g.207101 Transcript_74537/m.207101 type:complete len:170 (+) Transcript_74537:41-550(+)